MCSSDLDNPLKAEEYYQKALEIDPNYSEAWLELGDLYYSKGESEKANTCWKKVLETALNEEIATMAKERIFWYEF